MLALPLVGATIGAAAGCAALAAAAMFAHGIAAAIALVATLVLSGAIHFDGFLDTCDALFATVPIARRLEILKDPRHGSFALAGLLGLGSLWYAALAALPPASYPVTLAFAGALGRTAAISGATTHPYARGGSLDGFAYAFVVAVLACAAYLIAPAALAFVPIAIAAGWLLARAIARGFGGTLPGDGYGFVATVLEVASLVGATASFAAGRWPGHG